MNPVAVEALQSAVYVESYLECLENLPDDLQRYLTRIRELDVTYTACWRDVHNNLENCLIGKENELTAVQANRRSRAIARIQQSLIAAQELGDEKLQVVQLLQDLIDHKSRQLDLDYRNLISCLDYGNGNGNKDEAMSIESNSAKDLNLGGNGNSGNSQGQSGNNGNSNRSCSPVLERERDRNEKDKNERVSKRARRTRTDVSNNDRDRSVERESSPPVESSQRSTNNSNSGTGKKTGAGGKFVGAGKKKKRKARQSAAHSSRDDTPPPEDPDTIDPDEPTYCLCDQISYGEMILCDNDLCPIEWFHFPCVSLTTKPKGKWFCPTCRGDRPNTMKPKVQFLKELERYNREKEEKA